MLQSVINRNGFCSLDKIYKVNILEDDHKYQKDSKIHIGKNHDGNHDHRCCGYQNLNFSSFRHHSVVNKGF